MPRRPLPSKLERFPFTTAQAREAGIGRGRLRGSDLVHPHHGVHAVRSLDDDVRARCHRLSPALREEHWFSHRTAARIWGIPLPGRYDPAESLHVISVGARAPLRHAGTVGWVTSRDDIGRGTIDLLPVIAPADVWCQLALRDAVVPGGVMAHEWLVAAGDFLLTGRRRGGGRRDQPLCTIEDLWTAVVSRGRGRGVRPLERALADVRSPVDSPRESLLRVGLVAYGLPEPRVQVPVLTAAGLRHADLGYPQARQLIEYQGDEHRTSRKRWLADLTRVQLFEDAGYRVMLVGAHDIEPDLRPLADRVRRALASRADRP